MTTDQIKAEIIAAAKRNGTSPLQALAQAKAESNFSPTAVSSAGAIGIFQLMPGTAADLGVDPYDVYQNIDGGTRYIRQCNIWFPGRVDLSLSAYNWGIGNTYKMIWGSTSKPPQSAWPSPAIVLSSVPNETRDYINRVISYMTALVNDPVYLASGEGEIPPNRDGGNGGGGVEISDSDIKLIAGIVVFGMLAWILIRR